MKVTLIQFSDVTTYSGDWRPATDVKAMYLHPCEAVGIVVAEDEQSVKLLCLKSLDCVHTVIVIPKGSILHREEKEFDLDS